MTTTTPKQNAQTQDELQADLLARFSTYRRVEGERLANHLLRNMLQQSNKTLQDCGLKAFDEMADLKMQLLKAEAESTRAKQYANHYATILKAMSLRRPGIGLDKMAKHADEMIAEAKEALKWDPDISTTGAIGVIGAAEPERATH